MIFKRAALLLISTTVFAAAGFLLPLPDFTLPDIPPLSNEKKPTPPEIPSPVRKPYSPEDLSRLFDVKTSPVRSKEAAVPEELTSEASPSKPGATLPDSSLPPLPSLRYVGEAVIQGRTNYYLIAGRPGRLIRLTAESAGEYQLISAGENELILTCKERNIHVPKE